MNSAISRWRFVRLKSTIRSGSSNGWFATLYEHLFERVARPADAIKDRGRMGPSGPDFALRLAFPVEQLAEHEVEDPAVAVVEPLLRSVDPDAAFELDWIARVGRSCHLQGARAILQRGEIKALTPRQA